MIFSKQFRFLRNGHCLPRVEGSIAKPSPRALGFGVKLLVRFLSFLRLSHRLATNHDLENQARDVVQAGAQRHRRGLAMLRCKSGGGALGDRGPEPAPFRENVKGQVCENMRSGR